MQSYSPSPNSRIAVDLDAELIAWVDELLGYAEDSNLSQEAIEQYRIQAIESAVQKWCEQQSKQRLQYRAEQHRHRHDDDETGWLV
ncbi:hypothetical protein [Egbenema bharatensis]|uniref:hypothetical protein n=1 Tax=Egbenema bharatensis TaxID=3463334 RepID=UPI003A85090D